MVYTQQVNHFNLRSDVTWKRVHIANLRGLKTL